MSEKWVSVMSPWILISVYVFFAYVLAQHVGWIDAGAIALAFGLAAAVVPDSGRRSLRNLGRRRRQDPSARGPRPGARGHARTATPERPTPAARDVRVP